MRTIDVIALIVLLLVVAVYAYNYRSDFRQDHKRARHAFLVILPLFLLFGYLLYRFFIPLVVLICGPGSHHH